MSPERLKILYLSQLPSSPPRFGAQARMHGLMTSLARRHDLTAVSLFDEGFDPEDCRTAMERYCREVVLVPNPRGRNGTSKRMLQLRSLTSVHSFEHHRYWVPALQRTLDEVQRRTRFDLVNVEFPYLARLRLRQAPPGAVPPPLVIDAHEIAYDMVRQFARKRGGMGRSVYGELNWRKLRREELAAFRGADGVYTCSAEDRDRILAEVPTVSTAVVPNAADVDFYQPRAGDPPPDGRTVLFFGLLSTVPNVDGITWFVREIWARIVERRPDARLRILGKDPPPAVQALAGAGVEVVGFVEDLRPHLARASAIVVPLRLGGGTRLKIVEAMAMGKAIVSTSLGAEGIEALDGRDLLIENAPEGFARAVLRILDEPALAARVGTAARTLAVERYAWSTAAAELERFLRAVIGRQTHGATTHA